ncbi:MAG: hypothetical protein PVJ43_04800 [Gemmatimonadales bacterium]|jgi:hypothetical protein
MGAVRALLISLIAALGAGCASSPAPVPVVAETIDLYRLAGKWSGSYSSPTVGREGTITFMLEAGKDTAYGDVVMVPRGWKEPLSPIQDPAAAAREAPIPETLQIRFVRVEGSKLTGTMAPYKDPECGCAIYTTFEGIVEGDVIHGSFTARPGHGPPYKGTWKVQRKKEKG